VHVFTPEISPNIIAQTPCSPAAGPHTNSRASKKCCKSIDGHRYCRSNGWMRYYRSTAWSSLRVRPPYRDVVLRQY